VRKLWPGEATAYRDHLLRLDPDSRHRRFSGAVADEAIVKHAATAGDLGVVVYGFFVDGTLRGAAELRPMGELFARQAEAAFSIEQDWQSHGVGSALLERILLSARNRGITSLQMNCLADNKRMQQLARKFDAELKFDFGGVVGELDASYVTPMSVMREVVEDAYGLASAWFDASARLLRAA
jgi:GNAT superfamily N-acetyltransferase